MAKKQVTEVNEDLMFDASMYEFAFHILPTVAEAEVPSITEKLKALIQHSGGEIITEEKAERVELAYDIDKAVDGKHKRFHSAYFGWVRMNMSGDQLLAFKAELAHIPEVLRHLIVKLTKDEIKTPFFYHTAVRKNKATRIKSDSDEEPALVVDEVEAEAEVEENPEV